MSSQAVLDASAAVALLLDGGDGGRWVADQLRNTTLAAPSLLAFEAGNVIRRHEITHLVSADQAAQAHADLQDLAIDQWPYDVLAQRVWELRHNLSSYDASYVALAELVEAPLITLDRRIGRCPELRCEVLTFVSPAPR